MPAKEVRKRLFWLGIKGGLTTRWSRPPFGRQLSSVPLGRPDGRDGGKGHSGIPLLVGAGSGCRSSPLAGCEGSVIPGPESGERAGLVRAGGLKWVSLTGR